MGKTHTLVVGGTKGIGRAVVRLLAAENHQVSVIARCLPPATPAASLPNVKYWAADLTDQASVAPVLGEILEKNGKLGHLVCLQRYRGKDDDWLGEIETTVTGTRYLIERLADEFDSSGDRSIVLANSITDRFVVDNQPLSYHVAKAGIDQMIRYYAVTLGSRGIRVNGVSPGTILKEESKHFYLQNEHLHDLYRSIIPLNRMGTAEEVAQVIEFLCSPKASFITGQTIIVDGGLSLRWQETLALKLDSQKKHSPPPAAALP